MNAVSPVREVVLDLRVFRDLVDFLEQEEVMDPRFAFAFWHRSLFVFF